MRVLISHDSMNEGDFAFRLADELRKAGIEPRIENLKAVCGGDTDRLQRELRTRYNYVVSILSQSYMLDSFLATELLQAMMVEQTVKATYVIPVLVGECYVHPPLQSRLIDSRTLSFEEAFSQVNEHISDARQVFVAMKYGDPDLDSAYELAIKPTLEQFGFSVLRISEVQDAGSITEEIFAEIDRSVVVLADLTGERPNCYLEVGYAMALEKELILLVRQGEIVHFDLASRRIIEWSTPTKLRDALIPRLRAIKERATRQEVDSSGRSRGTAAGMP